MNNQVSHRGPDSAGYFKTDKFAFGHRRLSILDLSEDGTQPMKDELNGNIIIFNGEIYNYIELKQELILEGYTFKTQTDTEVILKAYDFWGHRCLERFNGMWAIVIYDAKKDQLFISRDRFGVKPIYYLRESSFFAIGSEIKQLLLFVPPKANKMYLTNFIVTGILEYSNETFFEKILKLPPSNYLIYDLKTGHLSQHRYFDLVRSESSLLTFKQAKQDFTDLFNSSIQLRLRSDVKVGTCLSGGLDSSAVASVAAEKYTNRKFQGIFAKSSELATDESYYANLVANSRAIDLTTITPTYEDFASKIDDVVRTQEEPFVSPSIVMQYLVMEKAKEIGCKVMLDGQGGDETLLGYEKYYPSILYEKWKRQGGLSFFDSIMKSRRNNYGLSIRNLVKYFFGMLFWRIRLLLHYYRASMLKFENLTNNYWYLKAISENVVKSPFDLQRFEIFHTNLPSLLRYEDKNSMRHSIEARLPFLDYRLVQYNLNLPSDFKIMDGWSKYILRVFLEDKLPKEVIWRKKKFGFNAPEATWIKKHEGHMIQEISNSKILQYLCNNRLQQVNRKNKYIFWRLYNIAVWERVYHVTISKT